MHILFLSQLFDPENSIKGAKFLNKLQEDDFTVEVLTTYPSYPAGELYPEFSRQKMRSIEHIEGIKVTRLPSYINRTASSIKRFFSYFSFGLNSLIYIIFFLKRPNIIYVYYPPVIGGLVALISKKFFRIPFIYDVQDLWPEALSAAGKLKKGSFFYKLIDKIILKIYLEADHIVVLSDGFKNKLISKGIPSDKITRIYNWTSELKNSADGFEKIDIFNNSKFNILYAGNIGPSQKLTYVIDAAKILAEEKKNHNIHFWFLGDGIELSSLKNKVSNLKISNVSFLDWVPPSEVSKFYFSSDALLVHLGSDVIFDITIPQKLQTYMYHQKPVLLGVSGDSANLLRKYDFGIIAEPCNPNSIYQAALEMSKIEEKKLAHLGLNGKECYDEIMSMNAGLTIINSLLKTLNINDKDLNKK